MTGGRRQLSCAALVVLAALTACAGTAQAAAPTIGAMWTTSVQATTARFNAEVNPGGKASSYHFDYITLAAYNANLAASKAGFTGASRVPFSGESSVPGTAPTTIAPAVTGLSAATSYRYRLTVNNADGGVTGPTRDFTTFPSTPFSLPDGRGWEMVSPIEKNGGQVEAPGALAGGGVLQAAADGQSVTYGSDASFAGGASGAATASQYVSARGQSGWSTVNVTAPLFAGSYDTSSEGVPFQLFSPDLSRAVMLSGRSCRGGETGCPVANPPLPGTDAPSGYRNYYLRDSASGTYGAMLGQDDLAYTDIGPEAFDLRYAGAAADLLHAVVSTCAALTPDASEVPLGEGCDPAKPNLYMYSGGALTLVNASPGAALGAQSGAVSSNGARVYFSDLTTGNLFLRNGVQLKQVDVAAGGGGAFQVATADGSAALFTKAGHIWRYEVATDSATDLTPSGLVLGVLGASADLSHVYYATTEGLFLRNGATTTKIADAPDVFTDVVDSSDYPPATGTARVSADGTKLIFVSSVSLTGYDNLDAASKAPEPEVFLYDSTGPGLICLSCNPTGARPIGPSSIPGALANGTALGSTRSYKPRVLSDDGKRVFFDTKDVLALSDTNLDNDVYQWEAQGKGSCTKAGGCVSLISSGLADNAHFVDASGDGENVFLLTDRSLVGADPGSVDLYDARVGGGFPEPVEPTPCNGDACQQVPFAPEDPVLTTVLAGPGNPSERYRTYGAKANKKCGKGKVRRSGRCVKKGSKKHGSKAGRRGGRR
jgi:hypothetical protein